jgi:hypothetical protein
MFVIVVAVQANTDSAHTVPEPSVYLNINEGGGQNILDLSGNGLSGTIHGAPRTQSSACGGGVQFNGIDEYVSIPFSSKNHPVKEITVDFWFTVDSFERQVLISSYKDGGYRIAFDDGGDLWWTVNIAGIGDISVPIQHESISLNQWHHVAGTYDGISSKIYLDGILRNSVNASGPIQYTYNNYVMLGVDAGSYDQPDPQCNGYLKGGMDEVKIYDSALLYGQIMDDWFHCHQAPKALTFEKVNRTLPDECTNQSVSFALGDRMLITRKMIASTPQDRAIWSVQVPQGSKLIVKVFDAYSLVYPDSWYIEIGDNGTRLTRAVAFPNTNNAPIEAIIPTGNATVIVKYFNGAGRFPASAYIDISCIVPAQVVTEPLQRIFSNPTIVIYTASWATLIALILVIYWLHCRNKGKVT